MSIKRAWIGIDPGATGALGMIREDGVVEVWDYPGDERGVLGLICSILKDSVSNGFNVERVVIEHQQARPGQGVSSTFKLGVNYGVWLAPIASKQWPLSTVRPDVWKKGLGYPGKANGETAAAHSKKLKEHSLTMARRMFPTAGVFLSRKMDHNRAEALLLAEIARKGA